MKIDNFGNYFMVAIGGLGTGLILLHLAQGLASGNFCFTSAKYGITACGVPAVIMESAAAVIGVLITYFGWYRLKKK